MSYQSHADLGGQSGNGAIVPEENEPLFHAAWEQRLWATTLAMGATGSWNLDRSRSARETLPDYAQRSYFEIWFGGLERLLLDHGLVQADELDQGHALTPPAPIPRTLAASAVPSVLAKGSSTLRTTTREPRFALGDAVRTLAEPVPHHTRLPAYARGQIGHISRVHGMHVFADAHALGHGESPEWLYTVVFDGHALFGERASPGSQVSIDAWEPYLLSAP